MTIRTVDPREAAALMTSGWVYLDVRSAPEFGEGRPRAAINVEWQVVGSRGLEHNPRFLEQVAAAVSRDARLIVGCKAFGRANSAAVALAGLGFRDVVVQRAGFDGVRDHFGRVVEPGWSRLGLPTECG
jgi:rhodanese-related sulfurtransferase